MARFHSTAATSEPRISGARGVYRPSLHSSRKASALAEPSSSNSHFAATLASTTRFIPRSAVRGLDPRCQEPWDILSEWRHAQVEAPQSLCQFPAASASSRLNRENGYDFGIKTAPMGLRASLQKIVNIFRQVPHQQIGHELLHAAAYASPP